MSGHCHRRCRLDSRFIHWHIHPSINVEGGDLYVRLFKCACLHVVLPLICSRF